MKWRERKSVIYDRFCGNKFQANGGEYAMGVNHHTNYM